MSQSLLFVIVETGEKFGSVQVSPTAAVVPVCLNPNLPSCVQPVCNPAAPHPRIFKPSSSSLLSQNDLCERVWCGAPVLFAFSLGFGLHLYEF